MPMPTPSETRARYLKRLAVAADESQTYRIRIAAVRSVLSADHPMRYRPDAEIAERLTRPWDVRLYLENGRGAERKVQRPPNTLCDVIRS